jgi:hypothetical protein
LSLALAQKDPLLRDSGLAALQSCAAFDPGVVLGLRAERAPVECGDVIVGKAIPPEVDPELAQTLTALVHAAHLKRLVTAAPRLEPPFSKQQFAEFSKTVLDEWVVAQARAIHEIAQSGSALVGYARGVVAVEAGLADMRFVGVVRDVPLPEDMSRDEELKEAYYSELDVALAPWKERGRDAALVGLKEFAAAGVLRDPRVERARVLLSELYGGRRIDRLDGLILPAPAYVEGADVAQRLAGQLPTYLLPRVLPDLDATAPGVLARLSQRGLPAGIRADLESRSLPPEVNFRFALALLGFGQKYWRASDFAAAETVLSREPEPRTPETQLMLGVAQALKLGPRDAVEMMLRGPQLPAGFSDVAALDALAKLHGEWAAAAAFDAAYILELAPPPGDPAFWRGIAQRYARAEALLPNPDDKARARELGSAAKATAKALVPLRRPPQPE